MPGYLGHVQRGSLIGVLVLVLVGGVVVFGGLFTRDHGTWTGMPQMDSRGVMASPVNFVGQSLPPQPMNAGMEMTKMAARDSSSGMGMAQMGGAGAPDRKIITNASLDLRVQDMDWTVNAIKDTVGKAGGNVENVSITEPQGDVRRGYLTVRVPSAKFQETFDDLKKTANVVVNQTMNGNDVTLASADLDARLKNKQAEEQSLQALLKQATKISDIIEVTDRLTTVRSQIESLQAEKRSLDNQTDMATISISITEDPKVTTEPNAFRSGNIFKAALNVLWHSLVAVASGIVIVLIAGLPIILIYVVLFWIVYYFTKKGVGKFFDR